MVRNPEVNDTAQVFPVVIKRFRRAKGFSFVGQRINGIEIQLSKG